MRARRHTARALRWLALFGLALLLAGSVALPELVTAAVIATGALAALGFVRRRRGFGPTFRLAWLRPYLSLPWGILRDCGVLLLTLAHALVRRERPAGVHDIEPYPPPKRRLLAERALMLLAGSATPTRVAIHADDDEGVVLVHRLPDRTP